MPIHVRTLCLLLVLADHTRQTRWDSKPGIVAEQKRRGGRDIPTRGVNGVSSSEPRKQVVKTAGQRSCSFWGRVSGGKDVRMTQPSV